jgi:hypothetical protein
VLVGLRSYSTMEIAAADLQVSADVYWKTSVRFNEQFTKFAGLVFQLKAHAAAVEGLFSKLSYTKSKIRNKMTVENMEMFAVVEDMLVKDVPLDSRPKKRKRLETTGIAPPLASSQEEGLPSLTEEMEEEVIDFLADFELMLLEDDDHTLPLDAMDPAEWEVASTIFEQSFDLQLLAVSVDADVDSIVAEEQDLSSDSDTNSDFDLIDCTS